MILLLFSPSFSQNPRFCSHHLQHFAVNQSLLASITKSFASLIVLLLQLTNGSRATLEEGVKSKWNGIFRIQRIMKRLHF